MQRRFIARTGAVLLTSVALLIIPACQQSTTNSTENVTESVSSNNGDECFNQCAAKGESDDICVLWCDKSSDYDKSGGSTDNDPAFDAPQGPATPGTFSLRFEHDGIVREVILYVPETFQPEQDTALMLVFHGFEGDAADFLKETDLQAYADRDGFLLAYPQGLLLSGDPHWNAALPGPDNKSDVDDLGFVQV